MEGLTKPGPINLKAGNISATWHKFIEKFEVFVIAAKRSNDTSKEKWALMMNEAGDDAMEIYKGIKDSLKTRTTNEAGEVVETDKSKEYQDVVEAFNEYVKDKKSVTYCRELFESRRQKPGEPFANWLTDLRNLIKDCEYKTIEDEMLRDRLVWGTCDRRLKETLRAKPKLNLEEAIEHSKAAESANRDNPDRHVDFVKASKKRTGPKQPQGPSQKPQRKSFGNNKDAHSKRQASDHQEAGPSGETYKCIKCDIWHKARQCPAYRRQCTKCQGWNHFPINCGREPRGPKQGNRPHRNGPKRRVDTVRRSRHVVSNWSDVDSEEEASLLQEKQVHVVSTAEDDDIVPPKRQRTEYTETLKVGGKHFIKFKLDPGSEVNILPYDVFQIINSSGQLKLTRSPVVLTGFDQSESRVEGTITLLTETKYGGSMHCEFMVTKAGSRPILGIEDCDQLNLVRRVHHPLVQAVEAEVFTMPETKAEFIKMHKEVFSGLGRFSQPVKIWVNPESPPGLCPPRRYNYSIVERLKAKLDSLEAQGVVAKVTGEMPRFLSNLVIKEKSNGDLRVCLDPENLNKAILRQNYPIPTLEEISCQVKDKTVFSVLDLKDGFWHAELDEDSSKLRSFVTPHGLYRFLKMPFGLSCAPEIFQYMTEQIFKGTGAIVYFDDVLIPGKEKADHDFILGKVLKKAKEENIRFNESKLQYRLSAVMFLGLLWSHNQIKVDPGRIAAIQALKEPKNKTQLQRVVAVFNHLRKFIPQMGTIAAPLCDMMSSKFAFQWLPVHAEAFNKLKECVAKAPALVPFDNTKPLVVQADASQTGLGAVLLQNGRIVSSASRKLTESEQNYAQIEKEMLALTVAAVKFEPFIYGMPDVVFQTDHQPLVAIFKKPIHKITNNRLKKFRVKMLKYQSRVEYLPGKYMYLADLLSRDYLEDPVEEDPTMMEVVHEVTKNLPLSASLKDSIKIETGKDPGLKEVAEYYQNGWPTNNKKLSPEAKPYWKLRNDLFVEDGLVVYEDRILVPVCLRTEVLKSLHAGHQGEKKTKARARQSVFWPSINNDINTLVAECRVCEMHSPAQRKEPLLPHEVPDNRFQKVSCDILSFNANPYLVIVDHYSKWLEINSFECREFANEIGSSIVTSSPEYARSNGLAEKAVHIAKQILKKSDDEKSQFLDLLREYNNTPLSRLNVSPSQILMSRICRTVVPMLNVNLKPKVIEVKPLLQSAQNKVKQWHDRKARGRTVEFEPGESIVYFRNRKWRKGTIVKKHPTPRSYIIMQTNGKELRRNTLYLRKSCSMPDRKDNRVMHYEFDLTNASTAPQVDQNPPGMELAAPDPLLDPPEDPPQDLPSQPEMTRRDDVDSISMPSTKW